jgi:hypothetical protein
MCKRMKIKNVDKTELYKALAQLNQKYDHNIAFNNITQYGKYFLVTLRVINANKKNGSVVGRKLNQSFLTYGKGIRANGSACWHVHGDFFDILLKIQPKAIIRTKMTTIFVARDYSTEDPFKTKIVGNWQDTNIGSIMHPIMYSEACECNQEDNSDPLGLNEEEPLKDNIPETYDILGKNAMTFRTVQQSHLSSECWSVQLEGITACDHCELRSTLDCGGKQIRVTGKNKLGFTVPI